MGSRDKVASLIGFATKAGKLTFGCELTVGSVRQRKRNGAILMLCASDASENTKKRVYNCGAYYKVPVGILGMTGDELSSVTGKQNFVAVIGVTDAGFADAIQKYSETDEATTSEA